MPLWTPTPESVQKTNLARFMATLQVVPPSLLPPPPRTLLPPLLALVWSCQAISKPEQVRFGHGLLCPAQTRVAWRREASGNPARDVSLLHRLSCELPEVVLPGVLDRLNLCFESPPAR